MTKASIVFHEVEGLYRVIPLIPFRRTPGVRFDLTPAGMPERIDAIDRVLHESSADSPGAVGELARPWYMHPHQQDHLMVLHGTRLTEIYTPRHGRIERFEITPSRIMKNGELFYDGPAMLVWPTHVFHRIKSGAAGSASVNFATREAGFDIKTNFSIYDVDTSTGEYRVVRPGHLDQEQLFAG